MNRMLVSGLFCVGLAALFVSACGGDSSIAPGTKTAAEVQAAGMGQSFAGKNKCNPKNADRPFVIEWDATDQSSFQARASNDVVFVKYEGCDLKIIDGCVVDSGEGLVRLVQAGGVDERLGRGARRQQRGRPLRNAGRRDVRRPRRGRARGGEFHKEVHRERHALGDARDHRPRRHREGRLGKDATHFSSTATTSAPSPSALRRRRSRRPPRAAPGCSPPAPTSREELESGEVGRPHRELLRRLGEGASETCKVPVASTRHASVTGGAGDGRRRRPPPWRPRRAEPRGGKDQGVDDREGRRCARSKRLRQGERRRRQGLHHGLRSATDQSRRPARPERLSTSTTFGTTRAQCLMLAGQCATGKTQARKTFEKTLGGQARRRGHRQGGRGLRGEVLPGRNDDAEGSAPEGEQRPEHGHQREEDGRADVHAGSSRR